MKKVTRRNVMVTLSGSAVLLCPAILNAQTVDFDWGEDVPTDVPLGQEKLVMLEAGETDVDVSDLEPGQVAVIGRATDDEEYVNTNGIQYVAVLRRTDAQMAVEPPSDAIVDPRFFVANLVCPHRGYAVGITGQEDAPFACTKRGSRHGSVFNAGGLGVAGKSAGDVLSVPAFSFSGDENTAVLQLA